ncbi:hypothetical protein B484DRAFT_396086, partial [Ochromonadaceae sp. CCMP2298]
AAKLPSLAHRLALLNVSDNYMGPIAAVYVSEMLNSPSCGLRTLHMARNDLGEDGGLFVATALIGNQSVTDFNGSSGATGQDLDSQTAADVSLMNGEFSSKKGGVEKMLVELVLRVNTDVPKPARAE